MPIEFPCPVCRQQVRTPDAAAGKKGKCPTCGTVLIIPSPAVAFPQLPPQPRESSPFPSSPVRPKPPPPPDSTPVLAPIPAPPAPGTVEFTCPSCHSLVRTPAAMAGRKGRCPNCNDIVQIPQRSAGASPKPAVKLPTAKPLSQTPAKPPEPEIVELEELVEEPKPAPAPAPVSGLTPLGPLVPIPAPVPGLTPIAPELLTGLPPAARVGAVQNPFAAASDPYASPAYAGGYYAPIDDSHRRGLSWEREPSIRV